MIAPFIEVPILDNADELLDFLTNFGYDTELIYATIPSEEDSDFGGFVAEVHLFSDDELVAVTTTWTDKKELIAFMKETISDDFQIE